MSSFTGLLIALESCSIDQRSTELQMQWAWSWWVFVPALVLFSIPSMFSRGAMNARNIAEHGDHADYRKDAGGALIGCVMAGAIYAAIVTAIAGLLF